MSDMEDFERLEELKARVKRDPVFRNLHQRMASAFDSGAANPADIRDVLFLYDHSPLDEMEE